MTSVENQINNIDFLRILESGFLKMEGGNENIFENDASYTRKL